jgi:hypothetical protein
MNTFPNYKHSELHGRSSYKFAPALLMLTHDFHLYPSPFPPTTEEACYRSSCSECRQQLPKSRSMILSVGSPLLSAGEIIDGQLKDRHLLGR